MHLEMQANQVLGTSLRVIGFFLFAQKAVDLWRREQHYNGQDYK